MRAIYPGSFDPITFGHLDIIHRAAEVFSEVIVAVAYNHQKEATFTPAERIEIIRAAIGETERIRLTSFDGLLVEFAKSLDAKVVVRGLRAISDFEFEVQMALMNRRLSPYLETVFLAAREEYSYLSSRTVKEIARLGGNIREFVPSSAADALLMKMEKGA